MIEAIKELGIVTTAVIAVAVFALFCGAIPFALLATTIELVLGR